MLDQFVNVSWEENYVETLDKFWMMRAEVSYLQNVWYDVDRNAQTFWFVDVFDDDMIRAIYELIVVQFEW
jgi:hypothetical protein